MTTMYRFPTIPADQLDAATGGDYPTRSPGLPESGGRCHINWGEVGGVTGGAAIANAKGGWLGAALGAAGGAVADITHQITNGACSSKKQ